MQQLHCLQKLPALALVPMQGFPHHLVEGVAGDFAAHGGPCRNKRKKAVFLLRGTEIL